MVDRSSLRLILVEDDDSVRENLIFLLRSNGFKVEAAFRDAEGFFAADDILSGDNCIILLDLELPGASGLDLLKKVKQMKSPPEVVVFTVVDDRESLFAALKAGANGYILKDSPLDNICRAIDELVAGGAPMSPAIARRVLQEFQTAAPDHDRLSTRETEVLSLLVNGFTYDEIGKKLFISSGTVQAHLKKIYRKLGVRTRTAAVAKAIRNRIVD